MPSLYPASYHYMLLKLLCSDEERWLNPINEIHNKNRETRRQYIIIHAWYMKNQREIYGNACIQAFWPFQLALTLWDSKRIITKGSHLVSRLVWNGKEWKRWTCELPHINLLHPVKLYVHLKIGTEKKRWKMKWSKNEISLASFFI